MVGVYCGTIEHVVPPPAGSCVCYKIITLSGGVRVGTLGVRVHIDDFSDDVLYLGGSCIPGFLVPSSYAFNIPRENIELIPLLSPLRDPYWNRCRLVDDDELWVHVENFDGRRESDRDLVSARMEREKHGLCRRLSFACVCT